MKYTYTQLLAVILLICSGLSHNLYAADVGQEIDEALRGSHRETRNRERDVFRHPKATLEFFGVMPEMSVIEISPGGGWYTEILAPIFRKEGRLTVAGFSKSENELAWKRNMAFALDDKLAKHPQVYDKVIVSELKFPEQTDIADEESADRILTFRNVHNWMKGGYAKAMFDLFYKTTKSGGVLGVVEHRALPGTSIEDMIKSGYVTEAYVIELAENSGFVFEARSDINANSNDTKSHPKGVWTLPPSLRFCKSLENDTEKNECIEKYTKVGESDRMTLKFRKP